MLRESEGGYEGDSHIGGINELLLSRLGKGLWFGVGLGGRRHWAGGTTPTFRTVFLLGVKRATFMGY